MVTREELASLSEDLKEEIRINWNPHRGQKVYNLLDLPQNPEMWVGYIVSDTFSNGNDPYFFVEYDSGWRGGVWKGSSLPMVTRQKLNELTNS